MDTGMPALTTILLLIFLITLNSAESQPTGFISIRDFSFQPETLTVPVGTTVTWMNYEMPLAGEKYTTDHTVTSDNGTFDSGTIASGGQFSHLFNRSGEYPYHDKFFPFMHGMVVVISNSTVVIVQ
jgi:plastocyanin